MKRKILAAMIATGIFFSGCGNEPVKEKPAPVETPAKPEPTPEELEEKRRAEEERRAKAEQIRQEQLAARQAALDDFNARFAENLGVGSIGVPSEQRSDAIIYPLDQTGEVYLSQKLSGNHFTGVYVHVTSVNQGTVFAALIFYEAAIKAFNPDADPNAVFSGLGLDANLVEDLPNPKEIKINGVTYSKKMIGKSLSLGMVK